jgi:hypothetical protein
MTVKKKKNTLEAYRIMKLLVIIVLNMNACNVMLLSFCVSVSVW